MRVLLLSLVLLSIVFQHCNCLPTLKETDVEIKDKLTHLLQRLKKTNSNHADRKDTRFAVYYPGMEVHYPAIHKSRTVLARSGSRANRVDPCGGGEPKRLTDSSGTITSPGGNGEYPNNANCKWLIEAPAGQTVSVSIDEMQLEVNGNSCFDHVDLYDGPTESSTVLASLCSPITSTTTSSGSSMLVVFQSDYSINTGGFYLHWTFGSGGAGPCGGGEPAKFTDTSGSITSPGGGGQYPDNANCKWLIEAAAGQTISATFDQIQLEKYGDNCIDSVTLYDGPTESSPVLASLCSPITSTTTSSGSSMLVVFQTDYSIHTGGFYLLWTFGGSRSTVPSTQPSQVSTPSGLMCGTQPIQPVGISSARIVGGMEARPNSWPWQCAVYSDLGGGGFLQCGGSVISSTYILTAAHCFFAESGRVPDSQVIVACGIHDRNAGFLDTNLNAQRFTGVTVIIHEGYSDDGNGDYDVAVVRLPSPLTYNNMVQPICLPSAPVADGTNCVVTGWGRTQNDAESSHLLRQLEVPIVNWDQCRGFHHAFQYFVTRNMLCAGHLSAGTDPCKGDSGGPLVCRQGGNYYQYGVVSFSVNVPWSTKLCANENSPMVYASVVQFLRWIQQQTGVVPSRRLKSKDMKPPTTTPSFIPLKDGDKLYAAQKELLNLLRHKSFEDSKSHADKKFKDMKPPTTTPAFVPVKDDDKLNAAEKELLNLLRRKSLADKA